MSNNNFSFSGAFLGLQPTEQKQLDDLREIQDHATRILEITKMPNGDPANTFRGDILRHCRAIEKLLRIDEKSIDWQKLIDDVWDSDKRTYKPPASGGIDWMGNLKSKPAAKPEKKQDKPGGVGSLFSL